VAVTKAPFDASLPWSVRLFATAPVPPPVSAVLLTAGFALAAALYSLAFGLPFVTTFVEIDLLQITMIGFTPAATVYALRGAERDLADLRPVLRSEAGAAGTGLERVYFLGRRWLVVSGLVGIAIALVLLFSPASWQHGRPPVADPIFVWAALRSSVLGWLVARTVAIELAVGFGFSRLGERDVQVDWLDQGPLRPFARKGLRSVFLLLLFSLFFSLFLLEPWGRVVAIPMLVLFPALCVFALLLPVSGVHRRISRAKAEELARVDSALRAEAEANLKEGAVAAAGARLSNLVAYRGLVEAANTWPFDLGVWIRFAVYVSLGLGSWLGGALVERLLGKALD
jgi:hypothetical protein